MKTLLITCVTLVVAGTPARAQERGRFGLAMGAPSSAMFIWNLSDRIAVLPKINFATSDSETTSESVLTFNGIPVSSYSITTRTEGWTVSPGFDVRVYVASWDNVRAYAAPGYGYSRSSSTVTFSTDSPFAPVPSEARELKSSGHDFRGVFGVEYTPHRRFGVFGELGIRHSTSEPRLPVPGTSTTTITSSASATGNASAIGAIFYF